MNERCPERCYCGASDCPRDCPRCYPYRAALIQVDDRDDVADDERDLRMERQWDEGGEG